MHPARSSAQNAPAFFSRITVSGFVDPYYVYNANTPKTPCAVINDVSVFNCLHAFDVAQRSLGFDLAEFGIEKKSTADSRVGFRVSGMFGPGTEMLADTGTHALLRNILEAYASYLATEHGHLQIDFGKFVTPAGIETVEPSQNWNASRSLLFALAIPHDHVGLRAEYAPTDWLELTGFVASGWSDVAENAGAKQVGFSVSASPFRTLTIRQSYIGGPEATTTISNGWRDLWDTVAAVRVGPHLDLAVNVDLGNDRNTLQSWQGLAAYVRRTIGDRFAVAVRLEQLWDHDGFMTGVSQDLQEGTVTAEYRHASWFVMRVDYRVDVTDEPYFLRGVSTTVRTQRVVSASWVLRFGPARNRPGIP